MLVDDGSERIGEARGQLMQCPTCGATLPDDARFCGACGTDLAAAPPMQPTAPMPGAAVAPAPYPTAEAAPPGYAPGYPPAPGQPVPGAQPPAQRRKTGLIVGIVIGVLVLLLACCGVGVFAALPAWRAYQSVKNVTTVPVSPESPAGQSQTEPSATQPDAGTAQPGATNPAPSAGQTNLQPTTPTLSQATAIALVGNYLDKAKAGQTAAAKAIVTSKYRSRITSEYYKLAAKDLSQFEVVKVEKGQGGYMVFVKETWRQGVWTNWYLVVLKDGKLVINDTGTE